jgi:hypothetical protein
MEKEKKIYPDSWQVRTDNTPHHVTQSAEKTLRGLWMTNATVHITSLQCMLHKQPILVWGLLYSACYILNQCPGEFFLQRM